MLPTSVVVRPHVWAALMAFVATGCGPTPPKPSRGDAIAERTESARRLLQDYEKTDTGHLKSPLLDTDAATRVGLLAATKTPQSLKQLTVEARGLDRFGRYTPWRRVTWTWRKGPRGVARLDLEKVVIAAQLRLPVEQAQDIRQLTWSALVPMPRERGLIHPPPTHAAPLAEFLVDAGVQPRSAWGAAPPACAVDDPIKEQAAIHHTATSAGGPGTYADQIRSIQAYHMDTRNWCDIGYHFVITADGKVWEARKVDSLGAHVYAHNYGNIGVSFVGCFMPGQWCEDRTDLLTPPQVMVENSSLLVGRLAEHYGINISQSSVKGHRDHSGAETSCPGDNLHTELSIIRDDARAHKEGGTGWVMGVVYDASITDSPDADGNVRLDGATVTCSCGESERVRYGDAYWSFELPPGVYTANIEAPGYAPAKTEFQVTNGETVWASVGLLPYDEAARTEVFVFDAEGGVDAPVADAFVSVNDGAARRTGANGTVTLTTPAGRAAILVRKEGFIAENKNAELVVGDNGRIEVGLYPETSWHPEGPTDNPPSGPLGVDEPGERQAGPPTPSSMNSSTGGCTASGTTGVMMSVLLVAPVLFWHRTRRHRTRGHRTRRRRTFGPARA